MIQMKNATLSWIVEGTALLMDIHAPLGDEIELHDQAIVEAMDSTSNTVDLILRLAPIVHEAPPPLKQLVEFRYQRHPQLGYVVVVGGRTHPVGRFLIASMSAIRGLKLHNVETLDEAQAFLKSRRTV